MNECSSGRLVSFLVEGDDVVSCEVCLEPFQPHLRPPKILPCGHNFCDQCLFSLCCHQQYYLLDSIKCPTCRASFSAEAAKSAPTNWDLCKILENVQKGREVNVTVIHVPDTANPVLPRTASLSVKSAQTKPTSTLKLWGRCGDCKRKLPARILSKAARFCLNCNVKETTIFYCLECCVNKHNGHEFLSLSQLQTEQLKVLRELRELQRKVKENRQGSTASRDSPNMSIASFAENELNDGLMALNGAIRLIESSTVFHPNRLREIRCKQITKCSRLLCYYRGINGSKEDLINVSPPSSYQRISTPRSKDTLDVGSLDFLLTAIQQQDSNSELLRLVRSMSPIDSAEQRQEAFLRVASAIATILYNDVTKEELAVYADALLHCFHQVSSSSRKIASSAKSISRKVVWKKVQLAYIELLRVGAKTYPSYHPERIALLDDLAYLCHLYADVCDQATVTICMIEAARARAADMKLEEIERMKAAQRLNEIDHHLLECRRLQRLQELRTTKASRPSKLKRLWKLFLRRSKHCK